MYSNGKQRVREHTSEQKLNQKEFEQCHIRQNIPKPKPENQ